MDNKKRSTKQCQLTIGRDWLILFKTLQEQKIEIAGNMTFDQTMRLAGIDTFDGNEASVDWDRSSPCSYAHFHTHPRTYVAISRCKYVPPSPFDVVGLMVADFLVSGSNKLGLVFGREGIYHMQIRRKVAIPYTNAEDHCLWLSNLLNAHYTTNQKALSFDRKEVEAYFRLAERHTGVHIGLIPWPTTGDLVLDNWTTLRPSRLLPDFNRRSLELCRWADDEYVEDIPGYHITARMYCDLLWGTSEQFIETRYSLPKLGIEL